MMGETSPNGVVIETGESEGTVLSHLSNYFLSLFPVLAVSYEKRELHQTLAQNTGNVVKCTCLSTSKNVRVHESSSNKKSAFWLKKRFLLVVQSVLHRA